MPLLQVTATENTLSNAAQDTLMQQLSNAVLKAERAPIESAGAQSLVWAYYDERPQDAIYVGGKPTNKAPLRIAVTTPEGALTETARESLVAEIGNIVDAHIGTYEGRLNHWAMLYELDEGSWAGGGQIFPLAGIQAAMDIPTA